MTDFIRNVFSAPPPEPDDELKELREQKAIADKHYRNGVDALRCMNRETNGVSKLRSAADAQLEAAQELRRELEG